MNGKFKILILLLALIPFCLKAEEYTRRVHRGFAKSQITALNVSNKFGTVEVNDQGGDSVTVTVTITIDTGSRDRAEKFFRLIGISINRSGGLLTAQTIIEENQKLQGNFSIDYKINIPRDRSLTISNKFGNVAVQALEAPGTFSIGYGNITAGTINSPGAGAVIDLSYGKADIESVNKLTADIKYSKVFIGQAGSMNLTTKYSGLNIDELKSLTLESKYDGVKLGKVGSINAVSKYTNYTIDELAQTLVLDTEYGSVRVGRINPGFSRIEVTSSYGGINIGLGSLSYQLDASCDYCEISYPGDKFQGNRSKENTSMRVLGKVGSPAAEQRVIIRSRYGGIKLD